MGNSDRGTSCLGTCLFFRTYPIGRQQASTRVLRVSPTYLFYHHKGDSGSTVRSRHPQVQTARRKPKRLTSFVVARRHDSACQMLMLFLFLDIVCLLSHTGQIDKCMINTGRLSRLPVCSRLHSSIPKCCGLLVLFASWLFSDYLVLMPNRLPQLLQFLSIRPH
jgi:hypothetical protein